MGTGVVLWIHEDELMLPAVCKQFYLLLTESGLCEGVDLLSVFSWKAQNKRTNKTKE